MDASSQHIRIEALGGPLCGAVISAPLLAPGADTYLIKTERPPENGEPLRHEIWAYRWANRSGKKGWIVEFVRFVGYQGLPPSSLKTENLKLNTPDEGGRS